MLQMMRYGGSDPTLSANAVLNVSLTPSNKCLSKYVAINSEAAVDTMEAWEQRQPGYGTTNIFNGSRLMPAAAIVSAFPNLQLADLYDEPILYSEYNAPEAADSWKAGYVYDLVGVKFQDGTYYSKADMTPGTPVTKEAYFTSNLKTYSVYQKDWLKIHLLNVDSSEPITCTWRKARSTYYWGNTDGTDYAWEGIQAIECYDIEGTNNGQDKWVDMYFKATPIEGVVGKKCTNDADYWFIPPSKINHIEDTNNIVFSTRYYHYGPAGASSAWASYPYASTSGNITISQSNSGNRLLDVAVLSIDGVLSGSYWDSEGFHSGISWPLANAISISKSNGNTTLTFNVDALKSYESAQSGINTTHVWYVYGCWESSTGSVNISSTDGQINETINVIASGNLNNIDGANSIKSYYTSLYKISYHTGDEYIKVSPVTGEDGSYQSNGTNGAIYPTNKFTKTNDGAKTRIYIGDEDLVSNNQCTITIQSTINGQPAAYTIKQFFPPESHNFGDTYTITSGGSSQTLNNENTITINPTAATSTLTINFGQGIDTSSARWLQMSQIDSPEYANLSFTFNQ